MSLFIVSLYNVVRAGLEFNWYQSLTVLGFAFFILNFPIFLAEINPSKNKLWKDEYILTFVLLFIACLLGLISIKTDYFFVVIGLLSFIRNLFFYAKRSDKYEIISIGFVLILSMSFCTKVWDGNYTHPLLIELTPFDTRPHLDTWFHVSIAQMIKTYHIPSTGLNGIPFIHYHFGSHLIFACLSKTLNIHTLNFYQLAYPAVFIPLFIKSILGLPIAWSERLNREYKASIWSWIVLTASMMGVFPNGIQQAATSNWNAFAISESYCVSLFFFFSTLHLMICHLQFSKESSGTQIEFYIFSLMLIFMVGLSKISTLFIFDVIIIYLAIRLKLYYQKSFVFLLVLIGVVSIACLNITMDEHYVNPFELFHFFRTFVQLNVFSFVLVYFFWSIILIIALILLLKWQPESVDKLFPKVLIETVLVICVAGFIPGALLNIDGGSAAYFMDIQFWFALSFILVIIPEFVSASNVFFASLIKKQQRILLVSTIVITLSVGFVVVRHFFNYSMNFVQHNYRIYNWVGGKHLKEETYAKKLSFTEFLRDWKHLQVQMDSNLRVSQDYKHLRRLYLMDTLTYNEKSKTTLKLLDSSQLSLKYPCNIYPFFIPALTGMALEDGYVFEDCFGKNYGFEYYSRRELSKEKYHPSGITNKLEITIRKEGVTLVPRNGK
ncbi:MAG TPA: hypothetical protein VGQ59_17075 [Cyclobacteriaceae bacterium]|nr:hypothetical protein [Cyclobacteriaceae bacterium]